jgi:hypothetical protein
MKPRGLAFENYYDVATYRRDSGVQAVSARNLMILKKQIHAKVLAT